MASGGARNRSGPAPDLNSARSERRGIGAVALPNEGYQGDVPDFPLSPAVVIYEYHDGDKKVRETDEGGTEARRAREAELWAWAWRTPQAAAWALEPWRHHAVAMWVRTAIICESSDATAADKNALHRFADQIGLTPAGLRENGWQVAVSEVPVEAGGKPDSAPVKKSARDRLSVVSGV